MKKGRAVKRGRAELENNLKRFGISLPAELLRRFDALLVKKNQANRSLAVADLIREALVQDEWSEGKGEQVATVTLLYEAQNTEAVRRLADHKRTMGEHLVSSLHLRLSSKQGLDVLVLQGPASVIRGQAETLLGLRGVLHGKLVMTTAAGM